MIKLLQTLLEQLHFFRMETRFIYGLPPTTTPLSFLVEQMKRAAIFIRVSSVHIAGWQHETKSRDANKIGRLYFCVCFNKEKFCLSIIGVILALVEKYSIQVTQNSPWRPGIDPIAANVKSSDGQVGIRSGISPNDFFFAAYHSTDV